MTCIRANSILVLLFSFFAFTEEKSLESENPASKEAPSSADLGEIMPEKDALPELPPGQDFVLANIKALKEKFESLSKDLNEAKIAQTNERLAESNVTNRGAYFSLSIKNSASALEYRLETTAIYLDGKKIAVGKRATYGLPPNASEIFFGELPPGCHELMVKVTYTRLKNHVLNSFNNAKRKEKIKASQTFMTKEGYITEIGVQIFEQANSLVPSFRAGNVRFKNIARPNFLKGSTPPSANELLEEGSFRINYKNEAGLKDHDLIRYSLSIDGLPLMADQIPKNKADMLFSDTISEGRHELEAVLLFAKNKWVRGGPSYNFRLRFKRPFYAINGKLTTLNLIVDPKNGSSKSADDITYARVQSEISVPREEEFFPKNSCEVLRKEKHERNASQVGE